MSFLGKSYFLALSVCLGAAVSGCNPVDSGAMDEEKEPHYVLGKSRVNAMDYPGAIEAFNQALEVNPRSGTAHFQLACLFDTKESDAAAAIFHYQEFLRLNPKADNAEVIRQRIYSCKQQLAADVLPLPSAPAAQKQLEDLAEKNHHLQEEVEKWRAYYAAQAAAPKLTPSNASTPAAATSLTPEDVSTPAAPQAAAKPAPAAKPAAPKVAPAPARTHIVAAGETLAAIARKHAVSLAALQSANPGVNPKKMRVGQTLNLPTP